MNNLKLYEIPALIEQAVNKVDEDGCLTEEALQELDNLEVTITDKAKGIGFIINRYEGFNNIIENEIKRLQSLNKSYKSNINSLKTYLSSNLQKLGKDKLETDYFKFSFRPSKLVNIIDEEKIPEEYILKKEYTSINKAKILCDLKLGKDISGATLEEHNHLQIR